MREFETQVPSGKDLLNLADKQILEHPNPLVFTPTLRFNGDDFNPSYTLDPVALDLDLGVIQAGDTMSWVYTLTAQGTTHGFERGYFAFLGDPFGGEVTSGNLRQTTVDRRRHSDRDHRFFRRRARGEHVRAHPARLRWAAHRALAKEIWVEARSGFEPLNKGFADLCLTTWLPRRSG